MNIIECWDCGNEYDDHWHEYCPDCCAYPDEDCGHHEDDYELVDEDEDFNNNLNNDTMNLAILKEAKREYKGLKPVLTYITENYKGLEDQFTSELINEVVRECMKDNQLAVTHNNRLFTVSLYELQSANRKPIEKHTIEDFQFYTLLGKAVDDQDMYIGGRIHISIKDLYIIEDYTEIINLQISEEEKGKLKLIEQQKRQVKKIDEEIAVEKQYVLDVKKYGTTDKWQIRQLKAVEVIRNSKSTNEEVLQAINTIA